MDPEQQLSSEEMQERHASPEEMTDDDLPALLGLMGVVGSELNKIDKFSIDQKARAMQLTNETIQRARKRQPGQPHEVQNQPLPEDPQVPAQKKNAPAKQTINQSPVINNDVLKAIQQVEKKVDKLYNTYDKLLSKICSKTKRITFTIANDTDK